MAIFSYCWRRLVLIFILASMLARGQAEWTEMAGSARYGGISSLSGTNQQTVMALDSKGFPIVCWVGNESGENQVYIKHWTGFAWQEIGTNSAHGNGISNDPSGIDLAREGGPAICVDPQDRIWVCWHDGSGKKMQVRRWNGATWDPIQTARTLTNYGDSFSQPSICVNALGNPSLAVADGNFPVFQMHVLQYNGGSWNALPAIPVPSYHFAPNLRYAPNGMLYLALTSGTYNGTALDVYALRWDGSNWLSLGNASGTAVDSYWPQLAFDTSSNPILCWMHQANGVHNIYVKKYISGIWTEFPAGSASNQGISKSTQANLHAGMPAINIDASGHPIIAYFQTTASGVVQTYVKRHDGTQWTEFSEGSASLRGISGSGTSAPAAYLSPESSINDYIAGQYGGPALACDANGRAIGAWPDNQNGNWQIYVKASFPYGTAQIDGTLTYEYDRLDQLIKVNSVDGRRVAYQYDASGNRILKTVTSQLICEAGPRMPQPRGVASAASNVSLLQLRLSASAEEALDLRSISIQGPGTVLEPVAISRVNTYLDADSSGEISLGDTLLTSGTFAMDQGRINLELTTGSLIIPAGDYRDVVIAADLSGTASSGQTLQLGVLDDTWIAARGMTSRRSIVALGAPVTGPVHRISAVPDPTPTPSPPQKSLCVAPANGAMDATTQTVLTWRNGGGASSYQVFFGPAGNMTPRGNQSATSASYSGLEYAAEYQWRVDAVNAYGTAPGDVWRFTTAEAPNPAQTPNQPPAWPAAYATAPVNGESVSANVPRIEIVPGAFDADGSIADYLVEIWREDAGTSGSAIADFHTVLLGSDIPSYAPTISFIAGATYKWRMKAFDNEGAASDFTPAMQFTPRSPTVNAVAVQSGRAVDVTFSDPLVDGVLTSGNYSVSGTGKGTLPEHPDLVAGLGGNSYRLSWAKGEMRDSGDVTITVANVADAASNGLGSPNNGTHYGGGIGTPPKLQSGSVETTHSMVCAFDEAMATSAGLPAAYIIAGNGRGSLTAHPMRVESITSSTFRLGWDEGEMRTGGDLEISARGAGDPAGNILTTASMVSLSGAALGVAPNVARVITRSAVMIDVEFSEPIFAGAEDVHHYRLSGNGQGGMPPNPDAVSLIQPNVARLTWNLPAMVQGGDITITVSGVYDLVGNILGAPNGGTHFGGGIAETGAKSWSLFQ